MSSTIPTQREIDWILNKVREDLDRATGARYCECVTHHGPASGFRTTRDPECTICSPYSGLISNPGWDGTGEHFDRLVESIKRGCGAGTAFVEPGDRVGPNARCSWYGTTPKGMTLERRDDCDRRKVLVPWPKIREQLIEREQAKEAGAEQLALEFV